MLVKDRSTRDLCREAEASAALLTARSIVRAKSSSIRRTRKEMFEWSTLESPSFITFFGP